MGRIDRDMDETLSYTLSTSLHLRLQAKQKDAWGNAGQHMHGYILAELCWTLEFRLLGQLCHGRWQESGPRPGIAGELM